MTGAVCPNCAAIGCQPLFDIAAVPTNSCLLVAARRTALDFPTGDIVLAVCEACSFIFNTAWQPQRTIYSDQYEETQSFSPTFNAFTRGIAEYLVDRYDVRGKTVLEIGCGKGEFLSLICELGGNSGVGYDPSFVPARNRANQKIRFVREFFSEKTTETAPDLLCCKMTLEHVAEPRQLLRAIRSRACHEDSVIFFQIPDVGRILREGAFWDVYYEHCSYFNAASLRRLFSGSGFRAERIWTGYDDQYLMILAKPAEDRTDRAAADVNDVAAIVRASRSFAATAERRRAAWRSRLREWYAGGYRTVLWGSGSKAVAFLTTLAADREIEYAVDINPYRVGKFLPKTGQKIVAPAFLRDYRPHNVVVMNPVYREEIARELAAQGLAPTIYTVVDLD